MVNNIKAQIKKLEDILMSGNCRNKYALQNKIKALQRQLREAERKTSWNEFLAQ